MMDTSLWPVIIYSPKVVSFIKKRNHHWPFLDSIFMPEPPRWLIQNNRLEDAAGVFRTISKVNRKKVPDNLMEMLEDIRAS